MKNKVMLYLFIVFLLVNIVDSITSYFILGGEANPIYIWFGNIWLVYILKIFVVGGVFLIIKKNDYGKHFTFYSLIVMLLYGSLILSYGIFSNTQGILNPQLVEAAKSIPNEVKVKAYTNFIVILYFIPAAITLFAFKIYEWGVKYTDLKPIK